LSGIQKFVCFTGLTAILQGLSCGALSAPLFDSEETLSIIIEVPLRTLIYERRSRPELPGVLRYTDSSGKEHALPLKVTTRGHSRLDMCDYPPIKVRFDAGHTEGTLFQDQRKLKLVTKCMRDRSANYWVHLELGAYRAYNAITPYAYRVRRLVVTYRDTDGKWKDRVEPAFFLEPDTQLAERVGRQRIRPPQVAPEQMSLAETTHHMLLQYLLGNTDFAVKRGPSGEGCCHNGRVYAHAGAERDFVIVPYDFDQSGMVNTEYAQADERLGIHNVTTRLYRGFCWQNERLPASIGLFNEKRAEIEGAFLVPEISKRQTRRVQRFIDNFYTTINDAEELQKRLLDQCRGPDSLPLRASPVSPSHAKLPAAN